MGRLFCAAEPRNSPSQTKTRGVGFARTEATIKPVANRTKRVWLFTVLATAVFLATVWELLRHDRLPGLGTFRLAMVCAAFVLVAVAFFFEEYLANRNLTTGLGVATERLRLAMESGKSVAWDWDLKTGRDTWFGDLRSMFGIPSDTFAGKTDDFYRYVHSEDRQRVANAVAAARADRAPYVAEFRVVWPDGTVRWVAARGNFQYGVNGEPQRMLGIAADITDRRRAEQALQKSEEKFSKAFRESPLTLTLTSARDHRYIDVNETFERITGWNRQEVIGRTPFDIGVWEDSSQRIELVRRVLASQPIRNFELRFRTRQGESRVGSGSAELIDIDGEPCVLSVIDDITDRKQAEEAQILHSAIIESSDDAIFFRDVNGIIRSWNAAAQRIFGYTEAEAIGQPIALLLPHELREVGKQIVQSVDRGEALAHYETVRLAKGNIPVDVSLTVSPVRDATGKVMGASVIARDMGDRKRAEAELRESEQRFRLVANTAPVMIWMAGPDKLCNYFNQPWLEFTGRSLEAEWGDGWAEGVHPDDLKACLDTYTTSFDQRLSFTMHYRLRRHDGEYRWLLDKGVPRFNANGSFAGYIGSCIDVTDRKLAEEALSSISQRLLEATEEERTRIARELHDDINQRIALLAIELDQCKQDLPASDVEVFRRLRKACKNLSEIGKDIQAISHRLHSSKLDYLGIVAAANSFCKEISEQHRVAIDFKHADIPQDLSRDISLCLFRVLQEALFNAVKHSGARDFHVNLRGTADAIELTVWDGGGGFDPEGAMNGHGLGLISMQERLNLVRGSLSIASQTGAGTTIRARVPIRYEHPSLAYRAG